MAGQELIEYLRAFGSRRNRRKAFRELLKFRTNMLRQTAPDTTRPQRRRTAKNTTWPRLRFPIAKPRWGFLGSIGIGDTITPMISQNVNDPPPRSIELAGDFVATADGPDDEGSDSAMYGGPPEA